MSEAVGAPTRYLHGLDVWRACLMMGGPILHGSMLHERNLLFDLIELISRSFRMGVFFSLSGLLAGLSLQRRSPRTWFLQHAVRIGVPALSGLVILSPITSFALLSATPSMTVSNSNFLNWYHVWYLYGLLAYSCLVFLTYGLINPEKLRSHLSIAERFNQVRILIMLSTIGFILASIAGALLVVAPERHFAILSQVRLIAAYAPLYGFGVILAYSERLRAVSTEGWHLPAAILALAAIGYACWYGSIQGSLAPDTFASWNIVVRTLGMTVCPPAATLLILRSALRIRTIGPKTRRLCAASFTVYMLHFPLLAIVNAALRYVPGNTFVEYGLAVVATTAACLAFHVLVVQRVPWLAFVLNGRRVVSEKSGLRGRLSVT